MPMWIYCNMGWERTAWWAEISPMQFWCVQQIPRPEISTGNPSMCSCKPLAPRHSLVWLCYTKNMEHEVKPVTPVQCKKEAEEAGERGGKELLIESLNSISRWPKEQTNCRGRQWPFAIWCGVKFFLPQIWSAVPAANNHWQLHPHWEDFHFWLGHS